MTGKDNINNIWTAGKVGACIGIMFAVFVLAIAFSTGPAAYVATAWTLFFVALIVGGLELLRRCHYGEGQ